MDFQSEKSFGKLRLMAFQPYHQILCILKHVGDVTDRSSTPKGCNIIYVKDVGDRNNLQYLRHCFDLLYSIQCIQCYVSQHLQHQTMCIDTY